MLEQDLAVAPLPTVWRLVLPVQLVQQHGNAAARAADDDLEIRVAIESAGRDQADAEIRDGGVGAHAYRHALPAILQPVERRVLAAASAAAVEKDGQVQLGGLAQHPS